jgi:hypothetical protein
MGHEIKTLVMMITLSAGAISERKISTEFKLSALSGVQYLITHAAGIRTRTFYAGPLADKYIRDDVCMRREYRSSRLPGWMGLYFYGDKMRNIFSPTSRSHPAGMSSL